jgi:hypothetical protein
MKGGLEFCPPLATSVSFEPDQTGTGWHAPATAPWLKSAVDAASNQFYAKLAMMMREGGTIPFMA